MENTMEKVSEQSVEEITWETMWKFLNINDYGEIVSAHDTSRWNGNETRSLPVSKYDYIRACSYGFHASPTPHEAYVYVTGDILAKVEGGGSQHCTGDKTAYEHMRIVKAVSIDTKEFFTYLMKKVEKILLEQGLLSEQEQAQLSEEEKEEYASFLQQKEQYKHYLALLTDGQDYETEHTYDHPITLHARLLECDTSSELLGEIRYNDTFTPHMNGIYQEWFEQTQPYIAPETRYCETCSDRLKTGEIEQGQTKCSDCSREKVICDSCGTSIYFDGAFQAKANGDTYNLCYGCGVCDGCGKACPDQDRTYDFSRGESLCSGCWEKKNG